MISPGHVLRGLGTFHRHFVAEMFFVALRSQLRLKLLPTRYSALCMSSVTHLSYMLDREYSSMNFKHDKSHNGRNCKGEMCFNKQHTAQIHTRRHVETETDFCKSDPDTFGNLKVIKETPIEAVEGDEGDEEEEIFLEHVPSAAQKLSNKQYAAMIKDLISQKKLADAIDILETVMLKDRVKPENFIYTLIIGECGRLGYTKKAFQLYNQMKKRALKVTPSVYTGLFNSCANSPWPNDGLKRANHLRQLMFEKGYEPNASNYHSMIKAFGRCGDLSTAFTLVDEMAEKKVPISDETFNFLLQACITDKEAGFRHALLVWRKMLQNKVKPDVFTYNLLLRCIRDCGLGDVDVTQDVFHRITEESKRQGYRISKPRPLLTAGNENSVQQLPHSARENETDKASLQEVSPLLENRPNLLAARPHFGNIIALSEVTKPEDRLILVGGCSGLLEQMNKHGVKPNIKTFTQLLDTIPSTRAAEQALLTAMEKAEVRPDIDFYNMLIKKRSMRFDYMNAHAVLKLIQRSSLHPDIVTFGVLALGCGTKQEAQCLLADMRDAGFRMNSEILGAMLRQGCCHFNFEYVLAIMETVIEEEVQPSEKFLEHLENFQKICQRKIRNKDTDLPQMDKTAGRNYFRRGFQKFCKRYTSWLKEIVPEKLGHPWDQFQKKAQTDTSTVKEDIRTRKQSKIKN